MMGMYKNIYPSYSTTYPSYSTTTLWLARLDPNHELHFTPHAPMHMY